MVKEEWISSTDKRKMAYFKKRRRFGRRYSKYGGLSKRRRRYSRRYKRGRRIVKFVKKLAYGVIKRTAEKKYVDLVEGASKFTESAADINVSPNQVANYVDMNSNTYGAIRFRRTYPPTINNGTGDYGVRIGDQIIALRQYFWGTVRINPNSIVSASASITGMVKIGFVRLVAIMQRDGYQTTAPYMSEVFTNTATASFPIYNTWAPLNVDTFRSKKYKIIYDKKVYFDINALTPVYKNFKFTVKNKRYNYTGGSGTPNNNGIYFAIWSDDAGWEGSGTPYSDKRTYQFILNYRMYYIDM